MSTNPSIHGSTGWTCRHQLVSRSSFDDGHEQRTQDGELRYLILPDTTLGALTEQIAIDPRRSVVVPADVDDHPVVRDGIRGMLDGDPRLTVVGEAAGGDEAVTTVGELDPDLVLMDLRMPAGDGLSAIRTLRKRSSSRPRILVLTTYDTDRDIHAAVDAGADGYLLKATPKAELIDAVLRAGAGESVLSPSAVQSLVTRGRAKQLTARETEVLEAIVHGGTNREVARSLLVSEATVKTHLLRIHLKLGVRDRAAAVRVAFERGLLGWGRSPPAPGSTPCGPTQLQLSRGTGPVPSRAVPVRRSGGRPLSRWRSTGWRSDRSPG
ncbi:MAG: response regulator transcription factor [Nakamurella sp.]